MSAVHSGGDRIRLGRVSSEIDELQTVTLHASPLQIARNAAMVSALLAFTAWYFLTQPSPLVIYLCAWAGIVGCTIALALQAIRALKIRQPVIILSPAGFLDVRISSGPIPWHCIKEISVHTFSAGSFRKHHMLLIYISSSCLKDIPLTASAISLMPLFLNRSQMHARMSIGHPEFGMSFDRFAELIQSYAEAHGVKTK